MHALIELESDFFWVGGMGILDMILSVAPVYCVTVGIHVCKPFSKFVLAKHLGNVLFLNFHESSNQ